MSHFISAQMVFFRLTIILLLMAAKW